MILPNDNSIYEELVNHIYICIEWNNDFIEEYYNELAWHPIEHPSVKQCESETYKQIEIYDCLKKFQETENIASSEGLFCEKCKSFTDHQKKLDI